jgi:hypothetical protein
MITVVVVLSLFWLAPAHADATDCADFQKAIGSCTTEGGLDSDGVTIAGNAAGATGNRGAKTSSDADPEAPAIKYGGGTQGARCDSPDRCPGSNSGIPAASPAPTPGTPGLSDVAQFLVGNPTVTTEPSGWTIAGLETNFIAGAGEREQSGELLGQPVVVHFTPVAYDWNYGDGYGQTVSTPGASWAASGLADFSKTPTSHAYAARGNYTVTVTVEFTARYQFAGAGWADIPGTLGLTSDPVTVTVKGVKTVLVGKTCTENPSGPGC